MLRFRFLLTWTLIWWMVMVDPTVGIDWHDDGTTLKQERERHAQMEAYVSRLTDKGTRAFNEIARMIREAPLGLMFGCGVGAIFAVKLFVFLFGFESTGVRKDTLASFLVRRQSGHIIKGSLLAKGQAAGASGLGIKVGALLFLFGAVIGGFMSRYR